MGRPFATPQELAPLRDPQARAHTAEIVTETRGKGASDRIRLHDARDLVGPSNLAQIVLDGQAFSLRITRNGKLILTK